MIKIEKTPTPPASLAIEKNKKNGSYRNPDVIALLRKDFHDKCYLCELNELQSVEVEHLKPHHGDKELKFDWNNLFYSCAHCNSVKNTPQYEDKLLNCCLVDPEEALLQKLENGHVVVVPLVQDEKALMTARLLTECFEKNNTGIRLIECETRVNALRKTMNLLYKTLADYEKSHSKRSLSILHGMLAREYKFSAFTRTYVREHLARYPYLEKAFNLHIKIYNISTDYIMARRINSGFALLILLEFLISMLLISFPTHSLLQFKKAS